MLYGAPRNFKIVALQSQESYDATDPSVQDTWVPVPDGTKPGASYDPFTGEIGPNPEPEAATLTAIQLYLAFAPAERIAIKTSTEPMVQEFWATYELAVQTGASIHMGSPSVTAMLAGLVAAEIIDEDRLADIRAGTPQ